MGSQLYIFLLVVYSVEIIVPIVVDQLLRSASLSYRPESGSRNKIPVIHLPVERRPCRVEHPLDYSCRAWNIDTVCLYHGPGALIVDEMCLADEFVKVVGTAHALLNDCLELAKVMQGISRGCTVEIICFADRPELVFRDHLEDGLLYRELRTDTDLRVESCRITLCLFAVPVIWSLPLVWSPHLHAGRAAERARSRACMHHVWSCSVYFCEYVEVFLLQFRARKHVAGGIPSDDRRVVAEPEHLVLE